MRTGQFTDEVKRLLEAKPSDDFEYYEITLLGNEDDSITRSVTTCFDGYTDAKPPREIRRASLVYADRMLNNLRQIGEPGLLVHDKKDLTVFLLFGGHAVIEKSLAEEHFPDLIAPREAAYSQTKGFLYLQSLPKQTLQHAPTKKLRMKTLKRDAYRCRVCGRSPSNNVDIELHVHHIFPWGKGGLTEEENLISLCATCHDGLEPHFEIALFALIGIDPVTERIRDSRAKYIEGLKHYQRIANRAWTKLKASAKSSTQ
jgi:hypothetical protein